MASRLKLLTHPTKSPQSRGRHHKNVRLILMKTLRHKAIVLVLLACLSAVLLAAFLWSRGLNNQKLERESYFISIHYAIASALLENDDRPLESILRDYCGDTSRILRPFPKGLSYHSDGSTFTLAEPTPRPISLFRKDRLVASDRDRPRWEFSREYATKYGQKLFPPVDHQ